MANRVPTSFMPLLLDKTGRPCLDPMKYLNSSVPTVLREKQLNNLFDKYLKLLGGNKTLAAYEAAKQEHLLFSKSSSKTIYINNCANFNRKLSSSPVYSEAQRERIGFEYIQATKGENTESGTTDSKETEAASKKRSAPDSKSNSSSKEPSVKIQKVSQTPINKLDPSIPRTPYLLTHGQLVDEDFPVSLSEENKQILINTKVSSTLVCGRCKQPFEYKYEEKEPKKFILEENCMHHPGRLKKVTYANERRYTCCGNDTSVPGCSKGAHVRELLKFQEMVREGIQFVKTKPAPKELKLRPDQLLGIDCEMCFTTQGFEVIRVTIVDEDHKPVYDKLIKPTAPIVDLNTRFSGITHKDMEGVTITLEDVQKELLESFIFQEHILVGHSLSSDLKVLRIIHDRVIDTAVSYSDPRGYKRSLKDVSAKLLKRLIQNEKEGGHDSLEDAIACLELAKIKIQRGPTFGIIL